MALLWMDGFDHYGTGTDGAAAMADGVYAATVSPGPSTSFVRTGTHSLKLSTDNAYYRRIFGRDYNAEPIGFGCAIYVHSALANGGVVFRLVNASNTVVTQMSLISDGSLAFYRRESGGSFTELGRTAAGTITQNAWHHVEIAAVCSDVSGAIECRVNGVTVLSLAGIATAITGTTGYAQLSMGIEPVVLSEWYIDDLYCWDSTGDANNTFLGDRRVYTLLPDTDTPVAEWEIVGETSGHAAIGKTAPDDLSYLQAQPSAASPPFVTSEFGLGAVPSEVSSIVAVQTYVRQRKTLPGDANTQASLLHSASEAAGADRPITTGWTYWTDVFERDPATGAPWTSAGLNDTSLRIRRTI